MRAARGIKEVVAIAMAATACQSAATQTSHRPAPSTTARQIANLHAFARLYGVLRWFHPSDAAAEVNWDDLACHGARKVLDARDAAALRGRLAQLIAPIAPTVQLASDGEAFAPAPAPSPSSANDLDIIAWQHEGFGDTTIRSSYASKRYHRDRVVPESGRPSGALWQSIDATQLRNVRIRLRGKIRTANRGAGRLWLRFDSGENREYYDNMRERPVTGTSWVDAELDATVTGNATRIAFGPVMSGTGIAWFDDLELSAREGDAWRVIPIKDPGFESGEPLADWAAGNGGPSSNPLKGWIARTDTVRPASGQWSLRMEPATTRLTQDLFDQVPRAGETIDLDLGGGLRARVPIALYSRNGRTIGDDAAAARRLLAADPAPTPDFDDICGIADVIVVWNALQHFWPYWDVTSVDWNAELDLALADALDDRTVDDHVMTLQRLSAAAPDGHAESICSGAHPREHLPFSVDLIEDKVVVTSSGIDTVRPGDMLVSIDGRAAGDVLAADAALQSGSRQYRLVAAAQELGAGSPGSVARLRLRRGSAEVEVAVPRGPKFTPRATRPPITRYDDGVYYVDLGRAGMKELTALIDRLAAAPGVVFDVRAYPNNNDDILSYLLSTPADFSEGMSIARLIRPDHAPDAVVSWKTSRSEVPVKTPHITGRVAFLTGPAAISYAESVMSIVEHYRLGEIVGAPTAGTNGNIAEITTPTGCRTIFTSMRVVKRDGSQHHLIGIRPTIPASQTLAGVVAGRDEVLDRALAYVRTGVR